MTSAPVSNWTSDTRGKSETVSNAAKTPMGTSGDICAAVDRTDDGLAKRGGILLARIGAGLTT